MALEYDIVSPFEAPWFVYVPPGLHQKLYYVHVLHVCILYDSYDKCCPIQLSLFGLSNGSALCCL